MSKISKKVIGVDVGAQFLTVSFNDLEDRDQVLILQILSARFYPFSKKFHQKITVWL